MDSIERQIEHVVDRDNMHKLIDELKPGEQAILVTQPVGTIVDMALSGDVTPTTIVGMLESAKFIFLRRASATECECGECET